MKKAFLFVCGLVAVQVGFWGTRVLAEENTQPSAKKQGKVSLWIFDARVRAAAPGIDRVIKLDEAQKKKLEKVYNEVFSAQDAQAAAKVLQNKQSTFADRQVARSTLVKARATFLKRCNEEVFTTQQRDEIQKIYKAYNEVVAAVRKEMAKKIVAGFNQKLDGILTPEQKQEMAKGKAAYEAALKAALEKRKQQQKEKTSGGNTTAPK